MCQVVAAAVGKPLRRDHEQEHSDKKGRRFRDRSVDAKSGDVERRAGPVTAHETGA